MLQHSYIGTEHILLGMLREGDGVAARVLRSLGVDIERCRNEILQELDPTGVPRDGPPSAPGRGDKPPARSAQPRLDKAYEVPDDSWRRAYFRGRQRPSEIEELSKEIEKIGVQKEDAIAKMNFEEAAKYREQENKLRAMRDERTERWAQTLEGRAASGKLREALAAAFGEQRKTLYLDVIHFDLILAFSRARREADWFHQDCIGTEHVLLALLTHCRDTVIGLLAKMGVEPAAVRAEVEKQITAGTATAPVADPSFTPGIVRALTLAREEATALNRSLVGLEHLLLGLLREGDGIAARILTNLRVDYEPLRNLCAAQPPT
jgi:ATP-dependent Clp protease ATP-binding subunit ClpA